MAKIIERVSGVAVYNLPASFSREIGRILVRFSYLENAIQEMVWDTMQIGDANGRIAVREPRVTDRLDMLRDLLGLRNGLLDEALFKSVRKRADLLAAKRHMLAHGIWYHHKAMNEWHVQLTRGSWPKTEEELIAGSKKIVPESVVITLGDLTSTTAEIGQLIGDLKVLRRSAHVAPESSPEKSQ